MPCIAPCFACSSGTTCLSCIGGYILNGTVCQESCNDGFYLSSQQVSYNNEVQDQNFGIYSQCLPCDVECSTCSGSASNCITCSQGYVMSSGSCVSSCPASSVNVNNICTNCPSLCYQCSSTTSCDACVSSAVLFEGQCVTGCPEGYFSSLITNTSINSAAYSCVICSQNCQSCNGRSQYNCLSCKEGYYLRYNMCLSECPAGFFANAATRTCSPCPSACTLCTSFSNCQSCAANFNLTNTNQCSSNTTTPCNVQFCMQCLPGTTDAC